jgi:hypothetical protein
LFKEVDRLLAGSKYDEAKNRLDEIANLLDGRRAFYGNS